MPGNHQHSISREVTSFPPLNLFYHFIFLWLLLKVSNERGRLWERWSLARTFVPWTSSKHVSILFCPRMLIFVWGSLKGRTWVGKCLKDWWKPCVFNRREKKGWSVFSTMHLVNQLDYICYGHNCKSSSLSYQSFIYKGLANISNCKIYITAVFALEEPCHVSLHRFSFVLPVLLLLHLPFQPEFRLFRPLCSWASETLAHFLLGYLLDCR